MKHVITVINISIGLTQCGFTKGTCEANPEGENRSFIFILCVKSVRLYQFKLAYVVLHMAFSKPSSKNGEILHFNLESHF